MIKSLAKQVSDSNRNNMDAFNKMACFLMEIKENNTENQKKIEKLEFATTSLMESNKTLIE